MRWKALFALAAAAFAQDLPPEVLLLARIKTHMRQEMKRITDCTCLQTIRRFHKQPNGTMAPFDTIRLETLFTGKRELYSTPGSGAFSEDHPMVFAGSGTIGDGMFGMFVQSIFVEEVATFTYRGEEALSGRHLVKYDYRIPLFLSGYHINLAEGSGIAGMKGSFWADPQSLDLVRLEVHADDIPPHLPVKEVIDVMNYSRVRIGDASLLLPEEGDMRLIRLSGTESRNLVELTHCRAFRAESTLKLDTDDNAPTRRAVLKTRPGLTIALRLETPVSEKLRVGAPVEAVVAGDVKSKSEILIPEGALVHGRLRRLERSTETGDAYSVALEFIAIEAQNAQVRFFADLQQAEGAQSIAPPALPGVGVFVMKGTQFELPTGTKLVWKTRDAK